MNLQMLITHIKVTIIFLSYRFRSAQTTGTNIFQCPDGHFISTFYTAYVGHERYYKFSCSGFSKKYTYMNESCTVSDIASTDIDDIYLSCGSEQYTVGLKVSENSSGITFWQLLCCNCSTARIRKSDCIDTKFINDNRGSSTFTTGTQIIRRWQAIIGNNDLRWWLQLCPVDVIYEKNHVDYPMSRARRQIPLGWYHKRFPSTNLGAEFMKQESLHEIKRFELHPGIENLPIFPRVPLKESKTGASRNTDNKKMNGKDVTESVPESVLKGSTKTSHTKTSNANKDDAMDYYEAYDSNFDRINEENKGTILGRVAGLLENIQDGLLFAQAALPTNKGRPVSTTTPEGPAFLMSRDDDSLTIGVKQSNPNSHTSSSIKLKRYGPKAQKPIQPESVTSKFKLGDPRAIQQMFEFFGLCKNQEL